MKTQQEEDKCEDCNKPVLDKDKGLQCEVCKRWYHPKCQNISDGTYKHLVMNESGHWYTVSRAILQFLSLLRHWCQFRLNKTTWKVNWTRSRRSQTCEVKVKLKNVGDMVKATDAMARATESMAKSTETKLETVVEASLVEGIEKNVECKMNDMVQIVKDDVAEALEVEKRKSNQVFHGVKESIDSLDEIGQDGGVKSLDQELVEKIMKAGLRLDATRDIEEVQCIGKYQEGKVRSLTVKITTLKPEMRF